MNDITVVIPLYNKEQTIRRTLESVLGQTFPAQEIIVVNDGSTDNSLAEAEAVVSSRIRIISQKNRGVSAARNAGIAASTTRYIAFLDGDDLWEPDFLSTIRGLIGDFPSCRVFVTGYRCTDGDQSRDIRNFPGDRGILTDYFLLACKGSPPIHASSVCLEKDAILSVGGFPEGIHLGEDLLTYARLYLSYRIAYSAEPKSNFSFPLAISSKTRFRSPEIPDLVAAELKKLTDPARDRGEYRSFIRYLGHWHKMRLSLFVLRGDRRHSLLEFRNVLRYNPSNLKAFLWIILCFLPKWVRNFLFDSLLSRTFR